MVRSKVVVICMPAQICCGTAHTVALTGSGTLYVWGSNAEGQLGIGKSQDVPMPLPLQIPCVKKVLLVAVGLSNAESGIATNEFIIHKM